MYRAATAEREHTTLHMRAIGARPTARSAAGRAQPGRSANPGWLGRVPCRTAVRSQPVGSVRPHNAHCSVARSATCSSFHGPPAPLLARSASCSSFSAPCPPAPLPRPCRALFLVPVAHLDLALGTQVGRAGSKAQERERVQVDPKGEADVRVDVVQELRIRRAAGRRRAPSVPSQAQTHTEARVRRRRRRRSGGTRARRTRVRAA